MAKNKQGEMFKRPRIERIENAGSEVVRLRDERAENKADLGNAEAEMLNAAQDNRAKLEKNSDGNPVYVFAEGKDQLVVVLTNKEKASVTRERMSDEPEAPAGDED